MMALRIQNAYRTHVIRVDYQARKTRRDAACRVQAHCRRLIASREYRLQLNAVARLQLEYRKRHPLKPSDDLNLLTMVSNWFANLGWAKDMHDPRRMSTGVWIAAAQHSKHTHRPSLPPSHLTPPSPSPSPLPPSLPPNRRPSRPAGRLRKATTHPISQQ